jgi:NitT/TauT family transport system ATP-binding protein
VIVMSPRPGRIVRVIEVPMARPRPIDVMGEPLFGRLTGDIRKLLYGRDAAGGNSGGGLS